MVVTNVFFTTGHALFKLTTLKGRAEAEAVSKTGHFNKSQASSSLICDYGPINLIDWSL